MKMETEDQRGAGACDWLSCRRTSKLHDERGYMWVRGTDGLVALTAQLSVPAPTFPGQSPALLNSPGPAFDIFFLSFLFWNNFRFRDKL